MIIPGWFPSGAVMGRPFEVEFLGSVDDEVNASSYDFLSQPLGTPSGDRLIVVAAMGANAGARTINSVSIAGGAATQIVQAGQASQGPVGIFQRLVPSGTTGTINVTLNNTVNGAGIGIWRLTGYRNATPVDSDGVVDPSNPDLNASVAVDEGGAVIAAAAIVFGGAFSLSGIDQDFQETTDVDFRMFGGHRAELAANPTYAVSGSTSGPNSEGALAVASWR